MHTTHHQLPSGSAEHNRGVLGLQIHRQWALMFRRTQSGFLGLQSPANGPSCSAEHYRTVLGFLIIVFGGTRGPIGRGFVTPKHPD
ncbi:Hypothetical protein FKW44_015947 [Caligus rogercresseyi]|uniref:Uncharacterized protein n=1 Tax=Caligus rogercresseyi TaxID=217165 RepID=A0A7T8H1S3_CALRO|nr:Hypothetical protein FKW44_015947 [Caligus rogercresseyi]